MAAGRPPRASRNNGPVALLVLAALALVGAWYFTRDPRSEMGAASGSPAALARGTEEEARRPPPAASDPRVLEYLSWVEDRDGSAASGRAKAVTAEGLHRLAAAMMVLAVRDSAGGLAASGRIAALDTLADRIAREATAGRQGELTNTAFVAAANMFQEMHRRRFPNVKNEVVETRLAANAIRRNAGLGGQLRSVDEFHARAAIVVRMMSEAR